jgi:hypothetical protein
MLEDTDLRLPPALQTFGADFALAMERAHHQPVVGTVPAQRRLRRQPRGWRELVRRHTRISAGVALVALVAASAGIAEASGVLGTAQPTNINSDQRAPLAQAADPTDLAMLGILRRAQQPGDALPMSAISAGPDDPAERSDGANGALARKVSFGAIGDAWVIPADGGLCLQSTGYVNGAVAFGGGGCDTDADGHPPYIQGLSGGIRAPGIYLITGLVPDGVSDVQFHFTDGSVDTVPVDQNVYMAEVRSGLTSTTFTNADGTVTTLPGATPPTSVPATPAPCAPAVDTGCQ